MTERQQECLRNARNYVWRAINELEKCAGRDGLSKEDLLNAYEQLTNVSMIIYMNI